MEDHEAHKNKTTGKIFFWELVTLIDVMLLGHWLEMRSIQGLHQL
jgi:Cu2+-exporting ATPase